MRQYYLSPLLVSKADKWRRAKAADFPLYQSQLHSQSAPCCSLQSHSPGAFSQCSPWAWMCWMRLNRPSAPHIFKARCGQSAAWRPTGPAHLRVSIQGLPFCLKPPKGFLSLYPGMRSEFQIRIRVSVWITCIRYLLKHISLSLFRLSGFTGPPKVVLSCVLPLSLSWRWVTHQR